MTRTWTRREVLAGLSMTAGMARATLARGDASQGVKWTPGTNIPKLKAPPNATDCHHHIYDARFPADPKALLHPPDALVEDYRQLRAQLGLSRSVIVQPSTYGTDNRCTLAALGALGSSSRAIAVVTPDVADSELTRLAGLGVKGIRFNLIQVGATSQEMIEPLAKRIAPLGLHIQINASADKILELMPLFEKLPCPLVFDHLAHIPEPDGPAHPLFDRMRRLIDSGRTWVKLSGPYIDSKIGAPTYSDSSAVARAYVKAVPERLVWGSDWPYPTEQTKKPDDAGLIDLLLDWVPDPAVRQRILVENPARLYGF